MIHSFQTLFERDIQRLQDEITAYEAENQLWELRPNIGNCAGNLALHLCGNLNHFIGATLGNSGYVRDRESEFTVKHVPKQELLEKIALTKKVVLSTLPQLQNADLNETYPLEFAGKALSTGEMLLQLLSHLNYHLGQINYHRRILSI